MVAMGYRKLSKLTGEHEFRDRFLIGPCSVACLRFDDM